VLDQTIKLREEKKGMLQNPDLDPDHDPRGGLDQEMREEDQGPDHVREARRVIREIDLEIDPEEDTVVTDLETGTAETDQEIETGTAETDPEIDIERGKMTNIGTNIEAETTLMN